MEKFCCVNQNDIINNQNYPSLINGNGSEDKYQTNRKIGKEKLPSSQIRLEEKKTESFERLESSSLIPISSKNVILNN